MPATPFDLSASINQSTLNNFLTVHHAVEYPKAQNVYKGSGNISQINLAYAYDVQAAGQIILNPPAPAAGTDDFATKYKKWALNMPEILASRKVSTGVLDFINTPPPNVEVVIPQVSITVTFTPLNTPTPKPVSVTLNYSVTAMGSVRLTSQNILQIVPVSVVVSDATAFNAQKALAMQQLKTAGALTADPCTQYEQLIEYVANELVAGRISTFIMNFPLPTPIHLFGSVGLANLGLSIANNYITITANAVLDASVPAITPAPRAVTTGATVPTFEVMNEGVSVAVAPASGKGASAQKTKAADPAPAPAAPGVILLISNNFFQLLADQFLNISGQGSKNGSASIFFYKLFYSYKISQPVTAITGNQLNVNFNFTGSAGATAGVNTHCGPVDISASATASADPAKLLANFTIDNARRNLNMSIGAKPFAINWNWSGLGFPLDQVLDLISDILSDVAEALFALLGGRFNRTLVTFPNAFPGTSYKYNTALNNVVGQNGDLALTGNITFLAS